MKCSTPHADWQSNKKLRRGPWEGRRSAPLPIATDNTCCFALFGRRLPGVHVHVHGRHLEGPNEIGLGNGFGADIGKDSLCAPHLCSLM